MKIDCFYHGATSTAAVYHLTQVPKLQYQDLYIGVQQPEFECNVLCISWQIDVTIECDNHENYLTYLAGSISFRHNTYPTLCRILNFSQLPGFGFYNYLLHNSQFLGTSTTVISSILERKSQNNKINAMARELFFVFLCPVCFGQEIVSTLDSFKTEHYKRDMQRLT